MSFSDNAPSIADGTKTYSQKVTESDESQGEVKYAIAKTVGGVTATINKSTGELTDITGNGAIWVTATSGELQAGYVLTVAYSTHEWNFYSTPLTLTSGDRLGNNPQAIGDAAVDGTEYDKTYWTYKYKSYQYEDGILTYYKDPIFAYKNSVDGDNALIIEETAGLQFSCNAECFGIQNNQANIHFRNVKFAGESTLTIPHLKKGQYIQFWWDPYSGSFKKGGSGATFTATNVKNLENQDINTKFSITGVAGDWNANQGKGDNPWGSTSFQVAEDGDVCFTIADNGWNDIIKIRVAEDYKTDFIAATNNFVDGGGFQGIAINSENSNNTILGGQSIVFSGYPQENHSMSATTSTYKVSQGKDLVEEERIKNTTNSGSVYYNLKLTAKKGCYGNVLVSQTIESPGENDKKYVVEKCEAWVGVGDLTVQKYPYTWDFTKYNCNWEKENDGNVKGTDLTRTETAYTYGVWLQNGMSVYAQSSYWKSGYKNTIDGTEVTEHTDRFDVPLFAPSVNIEADAFGKNENNVQTSSPLRPYLTTENDMPATDKEKKRYVFTNIVYDTNDKNKTKKETDLGFYIVYRSGKMSGANQAYLELPTFRQQSGNNRHLL